MLKRTDRTIYSGSCFETGIIFRKTVGTSVCFSAAARAKYDGEITIITHTFQSPGAYTKQSLSSRLLAKLSPANVGGNFKQAVLKMLAQNNGKFVGDAHISTMHRNLITHIVPLLFIAIFFLALPTLFAMLLPTNNPLMLGIFEATFAPALVFAVVFGSFALMNRNTDMAKYHGAEHKAIACLDATEPLTIANVRKYKRSSAKCSTSFAISILFFIAIAGVVGNSFVNTDSALARLLFRAIILPIAYFSVFGVYKATVNSDKKIAKVIIKIVTAPGIFVQNAINVAEPDDEQIEVAIAGINALISIETES